MPTTRSRKTRKKASRIAKGAAKKKRLSARSIQDLRVLADQIGKIIPATSPRKNGFCFQTIAKRHGLQKYWPTQGSKKELIFSLLKQVYQNHPRVFYRIFRENFAQGIERRQNAGDPVLQAEIEEMDNTLRRLEVNLSREIRELHLPKERPRIIPPPIEYQRTIDKLSLHPFLQPECAKLFKDGHVNESVRKALEKYEVYVQKKATLTSIGTNLMASAFNESSPRISLADLSTSRGRGLQEGFKFISMGSMGFWRNFCSHGDEEQMSHHDAIAIIATISHLLNYIDENSIS